MLYFKNDSNNTIAFSDKHYREQAIEALENLVKYLNALLNLNEGTAYALYKENTYEPPIVKIYVSSFANLCGFSMQSLCFEYGVKVDGSGDKWKAACIEQVDKIEKVEENVEENNVNLSTAIAVANEECNKGAFREGLQDGLQRYVKDACRTECSYEDSVERLMNWPDLIHGSMGLCTEVGELQDSVKRFIFYGKELDKVNVSEEIGDITWYLAILCKCLELDLSDVLQKNIEKLKKRYPEKFTEERALERNLEEERKVLEG